MKSNTQSDSTSSFDNAVLISTRKQPYPYPVGPQRRLVRLHPVARCAVCGAPLLRRPAFRAGVAGARTETGKASVHARYYVCGITAVVGWREVITILSLSSNAPECSLTIVSHASPSLQRTESMRLNAVVLRIA